MNYVWTPDILGDGYEATTVAHHRDYSGEVRSTIIRRCTGGCSRRGVLYVHGFSDYFLQHELGKVCNEHGLAFYAVDLRKYGRSIMAGQRMFEVRDLREYFPDIEVAFDAMRRDGVEECCLIGHSTGGLICSLLMCELPEPMVTSMVLNSPFLAWNLPWYERMFIPLIAAVGRLFPGLTIPQPKDTRYAHSLRREYMGEWAYNTAWKPDQMPDVDAGWIRAIETAQRRLRRGADIREPILVLTSARSAHRGDSIATFCSADGILDVSKIAAAARHLGPNVTIEQIDGGLHDLALSAPDARRAYYRRLFSFI